MTLPTPHRLPHAITLALRYGQVDIEMTMRLSSWIRAGVL